MQALCPEDVPEEVWQAVASQYEADWSPGPNYHVEYRDCRLAYQATLKYVFGDTSEPV